MDHLNESNGKDGIHNISTRISPIFVPISIVEFSLQCQIFSAKCGVLRWMLRKEEKWWNNWKSDITWLVNHCSKCL